jgi:ribulose-phosphate 3-epimerase
MNINGSILNLNPKTREEIIKFSNSGIDSIHLDVMDGIFVSELSFPIRECKNLFVDEKISVHLMVKDVKKYIDDFSILNPEYIIFHIETDNVLDNINYLKSKNIKVGIAINPDTEIEKIYPYLSLIDLVLVMSVNPGKGGQAFLESSLNKIDKLYDYRKQFNLSYLIEVDGGVNKNNISKLKKCDRVVVGSYLTNGNYKEQLEKLKDLI